MLDAAMRKIIDPPLDRFGRAAAKMGISANTVTITGFVIGMAAVPALATEQYWAALALILANRFCDGLDGAVARHSRVSDLGGYLDIVLDFIFYSAVIFGMALGRPEDAIAATFLVFSFIGTGSSFLTFSIIAAKRGVTSEARGRKSFYYLGGLTEGTETIGLFVAFCLFPDWFAPMAWVFGGLCWLTTATRIAEAHTAFRD